MVRCMVEFGEILSVKRDVERKIVEHYSTKDNDTFETIGYDIYEIDADASEIEVIHKDGKTKAVPIQTTPTEKPGCVYITMWKVEPNVQA